MSVERGTKSLHEHNKSLLYSNRPKFKETIRENIHVDRIRNDGVKFEKVNEIDVKKVIAQIRNNSKKGLLRELKIILISIYLTIIILP